MPDTSATDGYSDWRTRRLPEGNWVMRIGNKIERNLYIEWPNGRSEPVGQVDTVELAMFICNCVNKARRDALGGAVFQNHIAGDVGTHIQGTNINLTNL